jgi:hypothetical protein
MNVDDLYDEFLMVEGLGLRKLLGPAGIEGARAFRDYLADRLEAARQRREAAAPPPPGTGGKPPPPPRKAAPPPAPEPAPE